MMALAAYTAGFMASITCGLTAEYRDQLRNPTLVLNMELPYLTKSVGPEYARQ